MYESQKVLSKWRINVLVPIFFTSELLGWSFHNNDNLLTVSCQVQEIRQKEQIFSTIIHPYDNSVKFQRPSIKKDKLVYF